MGRRSHGAALYCEGRTAQVPPTVRSKPPAMTLLPKAQRREPLKDDSGERMSTIAAPGAVARTMFRRMSAHAMGMKATALCHKSHLVPKSTRSACSNCKHTFGLWHGKHHCRLCGEVVCRNCSTKRIMFRKKSVRCCDDCVATNVQRISLDQQQQAARPYGSESASLTATKRRNGTTLSSSSPKSSGRSEYSYSRRYSTPSRVEVHASSVRVSLNQPKQQLNSSSDEEMDSSNKDVDAAASKTSPSTASWQTQMPYFVAALAATVVGVISAMA